MRIYHAFLLSGALLLLAIGAAIVLGGGPEAIAAALGLLVGPLFVLCLIVLLTSGEAR
jgi:hypothetical protein